ncbi:hypothetical protein GQ53DRAFT_663855 [Thozetella sp. PMI_491]|nr:hypothetical protein GQ53DRAFT_663855 [Thozetella sp. PMI_491]
MEGFTAQGQYPKDRARPPPLHRTGSRCSTSSTKTRMTAHSNSSASSHPLSSPTTPSHAHRFHHASCGRAPTVDRPRSQLSREGSEDSKQPPQPVSSFLHERLQRERKVESERLAARASEDMMNASLDVGALQSSPSREGLLERRRPPSSSGGEPPQEKPLGAKGMEQAVSNLHKQNFDLKLELFHRRERQAALEERIEMLEKDKEQTDEINEKLVDELEKRDKAVEEAVAMIIMLEARVEKLLCEREMVRRVEAGGYFSSLDSAAPDEDLNTPRGVIPEPTKLIGDPMMLNRMPSFLSEQSENTENLRNVYLGARGSILSLHKMNEDGLDAGRNGLGGVHSPSLSVLSESSFISIYGQKDLQETASAVPANPSPLDGYVDNRATSKGGPGPHPSVVTPTRPRGYSGSQATARKGSDQFQTINDMLNMGGSPLQRLEKLDVGGVVQARDQSQPARRAKPQPQPKTKQEKRDALHKVLTNAPVLGRDVNPPHVLPPTPDTISTSTLRRYKNSNDTLFREQDAASEQAYLTLSETAVSERSVSGDHKDTFGVSRHGSKPGAPAPALDPGRGTFGADHNPEVMLSQPPLRRRRSADETTGYEAVPSLASTYDYWMRESMQPARVERLDPLSSVSQVGLDRDVGRISPDLFSFPSSTGGWATSAMFGSLGGSGYLGAGGGSVSPPPLAQTLDALGESLPTPLFGSGLTSPALGGAGGVNVAPPPPNRRSSLHARTGSTSLIIGSGTSASPSRPAPANGKLRKSPVRGGRARSNSIDARPPSANPDEIGLRQDRASTVPPQQSQAPPPPTPAPQDSHDRQPPQKQRHYPPTASQGSRSRGLNLFRRSTGSAESPQQLATPSSAPPTETSFKNIQSSSVGIPSWGRRTDLADDDRLSATPPPILRNKAPPARPVSEEGGARLELAGGGGVLVGAIPGSGSGVVSGAPVGDVRPTTPTTPLPVGPVGSAPRSDGTGKRRWLGLGRVSSLRNRAV